MIRTSYLYDTEEEIELEGRGTILRDGQPISTNQRQTSNSSKDSGNQGNTDSVASGSNLTTIHLTTKRR